MFKSIKISLLMATALSISSLSMLYSMEGKRLSQIKCSGGAVLPTFIDSNGTKQVILARETGGCDRGAYDDFSGKAERCDGHPVISAAREFWEEAILEKTIGFSKNDVKDYIDQTNSNTEYIIVYTNSYHGKTTHNVVYITDFTPYAQQLLNNFYTARQQTFDRSCREKDSIATIDWNTLKNTIANAGRRATVQIMASVIDPITQQASDEMIILRPIFVSKLKLFFQDKAFQQGAHEKVRFYSWDFVPEKCVESEVQ